MAQRAGDRGWRRRPDRRIQQVPRAARRRPGRKTRSIPTVLATLAVALLAASLARAEEGRIPIFEPVVLTQSGNYVVTRDITAGGTIIESTAANVEIDLNGFTLTTTGNASVINATGVGSMEIRNGSVISASTFESAIDLTGVAGVLTDTVIVEDVLVSGGNSCIYLTDVANFEILRNRILAPVRHGVRVVGAFSGWVVDNLIRDTGSDGVAIDAAGEGTVVRGNRIINAGDAAGPEGAAILVEGTAPIVERNTVIGTAEDGIVVKQATEATVRGNNVSGSGAAGILLLNSRNALVADNVSGSNGTHGIHLVNGDQSTIDRNVVSQNGVAGLRLDAASQNNTFGRTTAQANAGPCPAPAAAPVCAEPQVCDEGSTNQSFGDNLASGPC